MSVPRRTHRRHWGNELLDRLLDEAVLPGLEAVTLARDQQLFAPGARVRCVFFPTTSVCSILLSLRSGQRAEVATVGNEGFAGIPGLFCVPATEYAIAQIAGDAVSVEARGIRWLMRRNARVSELINRYLAHAYQSAQQSALCNSYHTVDQRLARWLLTAHDRARTDCFAMTQELLSHMVAATRPRITEAAKRLKSAGVIDYQRGVVHVINRWRLERRTCECYGAVKRPVYD